MDLATIAFLALVGSTVGFLSGLLGIGGGIIMFPLLLYVPPLLGLDSIEVKSITGLTMAQGFFAAVTALFNYQRKSLVNRPLVLTLGLSLFLSSLLGSLCSKLVADGPLLVVFGALALVAGVMMLIPRSHHRDDLTEEHVTFNRAAAVAIGIVLGFIIGLVGQGGAFILIPTMLYVLKVPLRVALGSTLGIGLFSSTAGMIGKVATGQVPYGMVVPLIISAVPASWLGSVIGTRVDTRFLRWLLAAFIIAAAGKVWMSIW